MSSTESLAAGGGVTETAELVDFDAFVAASSRRLLATAYLLTGDHGRAEDLLQTALARTWLVWARVESPEPYVRRAMVNTYASWWRRRWRDERPTDDLADRAYVEESVDQHDLWVALRRLPRGQRAVLVLRFYEDLTEVETAQVLGCSVGTVKSQSFKALAKLRSDPGLEGR
jgi:RNA polymerase sigma-70 factor (sigma-E family)